MGIFELVLMSRYRPIIGGELKTSKGSVTTRIMVKVGMFAKFTIMMSTTKSNTNMNESFLTKIEKIVMQTSSFAKRVLVSYKFYLIVGLITSFLYPYSLVYKCTSTDCYDLTMFIRFFNYIFIFTIIHLTCVLSMFEDPEVVLRILVIELVFFMFFSQLEFLLIAYIVKFPLTLTNSFMHSLNGNIDNGAAKWLSYLLSNGYMHSINGNIDNQNFVPEFLIPADAFRLATIDGLSRMPWNNLVFYTFLYVNTEQEFHAEIADIHFDPVILDDEGFEFNFCERLEYNYLKFQREGYFDRISFATLKHRWLSYLLSNGYMHSINGNIDRPDQRYHNVVVPDVLDPQGITLEHKVKWDAGDKILNGLTGFFSKEEARVRTISDSYKSCTEDGIDFKSMLTGKYSIILLLIVSLLIYISVPSILTRNLVFVALGLTLSYVTFIESFEEIQSEKLYEIWSTLEDKNDVDMEVLEPQGLASNISTISVVLLAGLSVLSGYKAKTSLLEGVLRATKVSESQTSNISLLIMKTMSSVHDFLLECSQDNLAKYFFVDAIDDEKVFDYQKRVASFVASFNSGNPESMIYCDDVYSTLYNEGRELSSKLDKKSFDHKVVFDCLTKLQTINMKIADMNVSMSGERVEPVALLLKGAPATMKGVLTKRIAKVLALATIPLEWRPSYLKDNREFFFPVPTDQFWDSYTSKAWVCFFDDIFQRRDAIADSDSDALRVIKIVNSAPYCLKMANVAQKNNVYFRSAFFLASTNLQNWSQIQSTTDIGAVRRRFHFEVDVSVNSKYVDENSKLDVSTLPKSTLYEDSTEIPNDYWDIKVIEKVGNVYGEETSVTLEQLIVLLIQRHSSHKRNFFVNRNSEDKLVTKMSEKLGYSWADDYSDHPSVFSAQGLDKHAKIKKFFRSLPTERLELYEDRFFYMLDRLKRIDLVGEGFVSSLFKLLDNGLDHEELDSLKQDPFLFIKALESKYKDFSALRIDPYSRQEVWVTPKKIYDSPLSKILSYFQMGCDFLKKYWHIIIVLGGSVALGCEYLKKFFQSIISFPQSVDASRMGKRVSGPLKTIKLSAKVGSAQPQGLPPTFEFSGLPKFDSLTFGLKDNKSDVLAKIFNKYFFIVYVVDHAVKDGDHDVLRLGHALNVKGQLFLMPFHFIFMVDEHRKSPSYEGSTVVFVTSSGSTKFSIPLEEFLENFKTTESASDRDLCLVKVPSAQRMSKGAISSIITRKDFENLIRTTSFSANLLGSYHPDVYKDAISIRSHYIQAAYDKSARVVSASWEENPNAVYNLFDTYSYRLNCSNGDCGSILAVSEANYENRLICGMHVAGHDKFGFSTSFDRELVDDLINHTFSDKTFVEEEIPPFLLEAQGLEPIGRLAHGYVPGEVFKSSIRKSKFFGKLPEPYDRVMTMPAKLKPFYSKEGELIDPLMKAFNKYGKEAPSIPFDLVERAIESYENLLIQNCKVVPVSRTVITLVEALHSFENVNSISSSTSSGFPMSLQCELDLKKIYYAAVESGIEEDIQIAYQRIATLVESILKQYRLGIRPFWAYKQCGKDETREWFKVFEGKTRLFSACPFILLVLFRMYFGSFVSSFIEMNIKIGSAVGVNPYSEQWDEIARALLKFSTGQFEPCVAAGDQGQFDTRQWIIIHNAILDMINRWYGGTEEETYIRSALFMEITNSRHVFRAEVYEWHSGLPSGNPLTAIINTIYNNIIFRMCWELSGLRIKDFNSCCYLIVLGDDNVFSVDLTKRDIFNELTLPKFMAMVGNEYTTELKGEAVFPFRPLTEIEFLKRSFRKDFLLNRWVAPLRESAIAEMLNWTKKGKEGDQISVDNLIFAIREFSLHGEEKFNFWKNHLLALKQKVLPLVQPHGDLPLNFKTCYFDVLKLEYFF